MYNTFSPVPPALVRDAIIAFMRQLLTPMIGVHDAQGAIEFYVAAFGAIEVGERHTYEGKIGHAEIMIGGAKIMIADEYPEHNSTPQRLGGTPVILHLMVGDVDGLTARAAAAGAEVIRAPGDGPAGRASKLRDPYGHVWFLNQSSK